MLPMGHDSRQMDRCVGGEIKSGRAGTAAVAMGHGAKTS